MKIAFDLQALQTESHDRGIGRYIKNLLQDLIPALVADGHDIIFIFNAEIYGRWDEQVSGLKREYPTAKVEYFSVPDYKVWAASFSNSAPLLDAVVSLYQSFLNSLMTDVIVFCSPFESYVHNCIQQIPVERNFFAVAILYDLIPLSDANYYLQDGLYRLIYFRQLEALKSVDRILAISDYVAREAVEILKIKSSKVVNVSGGPSFVQADLISYEARERFILSVPGGFDKRKNVETLIKAHLSLEQELRVAFPLFIVGKIPSSVKIEFKKLVGKDENIKFLGFVDDEKLKQLYSKCSIFVFSSISEGFGLPILEAMQFGAPVICGKETSLPEIVDEPKCYYHPNSKEQLSLKMKEFIDNITLRKSISEKLYIRAQQFSWKSVAQISKDAIEDNSIRKHLLEIENSSDELAYYIAQGPVDSRLLKVFATSLAYNRRVEERRLLLDISNIIHNDAKTGIQRVVRNLFKQLVLRPPEGFKTYPLFYNGSEFRVPLDVGDNFAEMKYKNNEIYEPNQGDVILCLDLLMHLTDEIEPIHRRFRNHGVSINFIVYDILLARFPEWWDPKFGKQFHEWLIYLASISDCLLCISKHVKEDLQNWICENLPNSTLPRIVSFGLGSDIDEGQGSSSPLSLQDEKRLKSISGNAFLMVGTIEPRKAYDEVLSEFEKLWHQDINVRLVIIGKKGWLTDRIIRRITTHAEFEKRLFWFSEASDNFLINAYERATCLIAASKGEGYGLPLIEAAKYKLPCIARDIPIFREVGNEETIYFDDINGDPLSAVVERFLKSPRPPTRDMQIKSWEEARNELVAELFKK